MTFEGGVPSPHVHPKSLDSGSTPEAFAARELELGSGTLTATDHGSMGACRQVYDLAKKKGLTPILGFEGYMRDDDCPILLETGAVRNADGKLSDTMKYAHFCVHARDQVSYERMGYLLSKADARAEQHGSERKPLVDWKVLEELGSLNTTLTSGCLIGMVQRHLLDRNDHATAIAYYERLRSLAPGRFYVEVFPHDCSRNYVEGVFLTLADGRVERYKFEKTLRVRDDGEVHELKAKELARKFPRGGYELIGHSHYRKWYDLEPTVVLSVREVQGFEENECRPWSPETTDIQAACNKFMLALARRYGDPVLVSDDSHYATSDHKVAQEVKLAQSGSWKFYGDYSRISDQRAYDHFRHTLGTSEAEFAGWLENNRQWAAGFKDFKLEYGPSLPASFYPKDTLQYVMQLIEQHGRLRWDRPEEVARLRTELDMLHHNGRIDLLPYFFVAEEACRVAAEAGVLGGPGRGSAAGLLLAYLLEITHVHPLRRGLSLERFLTKDRIVSGKLPDIDLDYADRDVLVKPEEGWLFRRFGNHAVQISTDTAMKLRLATKDVARARYGHVPPEVERLTKKFLEAPQGVTDLKFVQGYVADDGTPIKGSLEPDHGGSDAALQEFVRSYPAVWDDVLKVLGLAKNKGRHPCGHVVADRPIEDFIPTMSVSGVKVTQYTAESVEACGGVKMDFLGVNSVLDIQKCIALIQQRSGVTVPAEMQVDGVRVPGYRLVPHRGQFHDVWDLPEEQEVVGDIAAGRSETVFQFHTPAAVQWMKQFDHQRPDGTPLMRTVYDLAVFTALDRPGPLDKAVANPEQEGKTHNMLVEYARRARGLTPSPEVPAFMERLFPETHGVMVFQEQLQRAYQELTGCTGAEAEEFRSNVAKKKMEKVEAAWTFFAPRAAEKLGGEEYARAAWDFFISFGAYGFNLSHAVCYALIGYTCAWLKHHYPLEWWCAVLRNADKNEVTGTFWRYCGHLIDLPDLTRGAADFEIVGKRIVAPARLLHGIGEKAHQQLLEAAPARNVREFVEQIQASCKARGHAVVKTKVKKDKKTGIETTEEVASFKAGHSSVTSGVVSNLIVIGAMDTLFPEDIRNGAVIDKLDYYLTTHQEVTGKKMAKKAREELQGKYAEMTPLARYLKCREVLPAYAADLRPLAAPIARARFEARKDGWRCKGVPVVSAHDLQLLEGGPTLPPGGYRVAVVGAVASTRKFTYHGHKQALEIVLDVEGDSRKLVGWPDDDGELAPYLQVPLDGTVVVALLAKTKVEKPFSLDDVWTIQQPLEATKEQSTDE